MRWRGRSERVPRWEKRLMLENDQNKCVYSYICCYRKYEHENLDLREETLQIRDRVEWEREYDGIRCTIGRWTHNGQPTVTSTWQMSKVEREETRGLQSNRHEEASDSPKMKALPYSIRAIVLVGRNTINGSSSLVVRLEFAENQFTCTGRTNIWLTEGAVHLKRPVERRIRYKQCDSNAWIPSLSSRITPPSTSLSWNPNCKKHFSKHEEILTAKSTSLSTRIERDWTVMKQSHTARKCEHYILGRDRVMQVYNGSLHPRGPV